MEAVVARLGAQEIATFRYQFPYMEQGRRPPSPRGTLLATVRAAVAIAQTEVGDLPILAGGKSMGGRMTSLAASEEALPGVKGLVFFGFPLHAAGKPSVERGAHLSDVDLPMLFLQGTRDKLAELELLTPIREALGARSTLHIVEGGDHSFHVLKRSGRTDDEVLDEICVAVHDFAEAVAGSGRAPGVSEAG
jgi:predicted alpha/beta-hydrolase family hydrolase